MEDMFKNIAPEKAGIPSGAILRFIEQLEKNEVNMHSFMMLREDEIFAEAYWKPFNKDFQHRMYSIGKSFTSIAIGLLQEEGKLRITDYICSYFPDKIPTDGIHEYIKNTTIKDMLRMTTPHSKTTYKGYHNGDWVQSFFRVKPSHAPGTIFSYDTSAAHVLSALVERLSGKSLMNYLREKVLDYIDFSEDAKFITDSMGISQGGSGLICTMRDLAKFTYVCMNDGRYKDRQLIPREYIHEATKKQSDTFIQPVIDEQQGYGYQIWKSRYNGFTLYGMGGQLSICLPQYRIIFTTTADTQGNPTGLQSIYDAFWQQIYPFIEKTYEQLHEDILSNNKLKEKIESLSIKSIQGKITSPYEKKVNGKKYILEDNPMNFRYFRINYSGEEGTIEYENSNGKFLIPFLLGRINVFKIESINIPMIISVAWKSDNVFAIQVNLIGETLGSVRVNIGFNGRYATISMKKSVEWLLDKYDGIAAGYMEE